MSSITDLESAIEKLPLDQVAELAAWLEAFRNKQAASPPIENWLNNARGAALPGKTTAMVMALTRGEE